MLDVILHVEVDGDVGSYPGRPALSDVGLGHLHYGEGGDGLSHPGPAAEHHPAVLGLPVGGTGETASQTVRQSAPGCCQDRNNRWDLGQREAPLLACLLLLWKKTSKSLPPLDIMGTLNMLSNGFPNVAHQMSQSLNKILP